MRSTILQAVCTAATCFQSAWAQLAPADNATMPTSMFMTRPQAFAPALSVTQHGDFAPGYIFIAPYQNTNAGPYIYDKSGNLVWDGFSIVGSANAHDFKVCQYQGVPHLCLSQMNQQNGYGFGQALVIDSNYRVVTSIQTGGDAMPADMHEFQLLDGADGATAILTSFRAIPYDLSGFNITTGQGWLLEGMFQEVDVRSGEVLFEWYSANHVDPTETLISPNGSAQAGDGFTPATAFDYFHINSIDKSALTGNYLVSARHTSAIYYINSTTQSVIWQLSYFGQSDFNCTNFNFSFQHDARIQSETDGQMDISFFDDATDCASNSSSPQSSGRFITIDYGTGTATETRRILSPDGILSCSQGNTQVLPGTDGHVFQGWGDKPWISEVDGNGTLVLTANFGDGLPTEIESVMNYRAFSFEWESTPSNTKPSVYSYALNTNTSTQVYVSWNGATTVSTWRYYGCSRIGDTFGSIGSTEHAGFETFWQAPAYYPWIMVEALAQDGTSLANSSFQPTFVPSTTLATHCSDAECPAVSTYTS